MKLESAPDLSFGQSAKRAGQSAAGAIDPGEVLEQADSEARSVSRSIDDACKEDAGEQEKAENISTARPLEPP